jgi:hypothetical protein
VYPSSIPLAHHEHKMDLTTCAVVGWQNPDLEALRVRAFDDMVARVSQEEQYSAMEASEYEKHENSLRRILMKFDYSLETSLTHWKQ